jgi:L-lactate dehydrogenase complex protein LldF
MLNRRLMNKGGSGIKNFVLKNFYKSKWGDRRELPVLAPKSFNELWRERPS